MLRGKKQKRRIKKLQFPKPKPPASAPPKILSTPTFKLEGVLAIKKIKIVVLAGGGGRLSPQSPLQMWKPAATAPKVCTFRFLRYAIFWICGWSNRSTRSTSRPLLDYSIESPLHFIQEHFTETILKMLLSVYENINDLKRSYEMEFGLSHLCPCRH